MGQKGNSNARKYTEEVVSNLLDDFLEFIDENEEIILKEEVFNHFRIGQSYWARWKADFANISEIMDKMDIVEGALKVRVLNPAIKGINSSNFTQFYLKNAYRDDYKDKQEVEISGVNSLMGMIKELDKK